MHDDISAIPTTGCNVLASDTQLYNYNSNVRKTYRQVGGKWIFTSQDNYATLPSNYQCINVSQLSSNSVFYPLLVFVAFCLAIIVWTIVWKLIKPLLRWRI